MNRLRQHSKKALLRAERCFVTPSVNNSYLLSVESGDSFASIAKLFPSLSSAKSFVRRYRPDLILIERSVN